jgi:amidohydrolase
MGSEDFAFYTQRIPGMLIRVGTAHGQHGSAPLHSSSFDIDERAIAIACRLLVRSVLVWFNPALA